MKVVYVGHFDEVEILETGQIAKQGVAVEVADELGRRLLEQNTWAQKEGNR